MYRTSHLVYIIYMKLNIIINAFKIDLLNVKQKRDLFPGTKKIQSFLTRILRNWSTASVKYFIVCRPSNTMQESISSQSQGKEKHKNISYVTFFDTFKPFES